MLGLVFTPTLFAGTTLIGAMLLIGFALRGGLTLKGSFLTPAAALIVAVGWSTGYLKERFRPIESAYGR